MEKLVLPLLTQDLEGIGGIIKSRPEDFLVEELPAYEPSGEGTHLYALIEKRGITTIAPSQESQRSKNAA